MHNLLEELNPQQRLAVTTTEGPLLVIAGAGSGKTRVLTYRIAYLIEELGVSPYSVLAITFTNKAAAQMRERLLKLAGERAEQMWISTFHSACVRILRRDIERVGYERGFTIYDSSDQKALIKDCIKQVGLGEKEYTPAYCLSKISSAKDLLLGPEEFEQTYQNDFRMKGIARVYELYQKRLHQNNAVDFDDLIVLTVKLLSENKDVLHYYSNKFRYIHVDEYQDTNNAQYQLVSLLSSAHKNLCVVGDDDQSIYKFRGADITNILEFEKTFPNAKVIKLEQNYRSTGKILEAANNVILNNEGRKGKKLWTENEEGALVTLCRLPTERDEAAYIADEIWELNQNQGIPYSDIAVLYRMNAQARAVEEALIRRAVPYRIMAGHRFYDLKEIKDIIAYLRIIANPDDNVSLVRIINEPKRKIGKTTVDNLAAAADEAGVSIMEFISSDENLPLMGRSAENVRRFANIINSLRVVSGEMSISSFISEMLDKTGYAAQFITAEKNPESEARLENIKEFVSVGVNYEKTAEEPSLGDFLDGVSLISDIDSFDEMQEAVSLMTLHTAKGLEFPVVFLCGAEEGVFPGTRAMFEKDEVEEERRLCYVGITRSRKKLYITHAKERTLFGFTSHNPVSRFIKEIPGDLFDEIDKAAPQKPQGISFGSHPKPGNDFAYKPPQRKNPAFEKSAFVDYKRGDSVEHKKFGRGIITDAIPVGNDVKLEIAFENAGTKTLLAVYANLTKL